MVKETAVEPTLFLPGSSRDQRSSRADQSQMILRIHRGRPWSSTQRTPLSMHSMSSTLSVNSNGDDAISIPPIQCSNSHTPRRATSMRIHRQRHENISIKVSFPSSENVLDLSSPFVSSPPPNSNSVTENTRNKIGFINARRPCFKTSLFGIGETSFNTDTCANSVTDSQRNVKAAIDGNISGQINPSGKKRGGKRSAKFQVKRFRMETKAAKTLAIIVGGFIFCWLPFFTMYLIRAFCEECIEPTIFSVLFWLGYCNSAVNPLIYALFSNEFRIAFKRILCRCVCTRSGFRASENFHMIAARALMAPATFHKTISGCSDDEDGGINFS